MPLTYGTYNNTFIHTRILWLGKGALDSSRVMFDNYFFFNIILDPHISSLYIDLFFFTLFFCMIVCFIHIFHAKCSPIIITFHHDKTKLNSVWYRTILYRHGMMHEWHEMFLWQHSRQVERIDLENYECLKLEWFRPFE